MSRTSETPLSVTLKEISRKLRETCKNSSKSKIYELVVNEYLYMSVYMYICFFIYSVWFINMSGGSVKVVV